MRTPLGRVRGLGSAREGTGDFWRQRLTAVANVPLVLFLIGLLVALDGSGYAAVRDALGNPFVALMVALAFLSILTHMRIGMQVIIEDYIHGEGLKIALLMLNLFYCVAIGVTVAYALVKLAIGG